MTDPNLELPQTLLSRALPRGAEQHSNQGTVVILVSFVTEMLLLIRRIQEAAAELMTTISDEMATETRQDLQVKWASPATDATLCGVRAKASNGRRDL